MKHEQVFLVTVVDEDDEVYEFIFSCPQKANSFLKTVEHTDSEIAPKYVDLPEWDGMYN